MLAGSYKRTMRQGHDNAPASERLAGPQTDIPSASSQFPLSLSLKPNVRAPETHRKSGPSLQHAYSPLGQSARRLAVPVWR